MAKKIANSTFILHRDGKQVVVKPGELFDFTDDELADIEAVNPEGVRDPVNEAAETPAAATTKKAAAKKGEGEL